MNRAIPHINRHIAEIKHQVTVHFGHDGLRVEDFKRLIQTLDQLKVLSTSTELGNKDPERLSGLASHLTYLNINYRDMPTREVISQVNQLLYIMD